MALKSIEKTQMRIYLLVCSKNELGSQLGIQMGIQKVCLKMQTQ